MAENTLIFVPGFLGSSIGYHRKRILPPFPIWLNPTAILAGYFPRMRLAVPGEDEPPPAGGDLDPGPPLPFYYGFLMSSLRALGWNVVAPVFDWRGPIEQDALDLYGLMKTHGASGPVRVLCHSRGGLVTRYALALLQAEGKLGLVRRVMSLGTPHTGSMLAVQLLACYHATKKRLTDLGKFLPGVVVRHLGAAEVAHVMRSWPGAYQLLPKIGAPWNLPDPGDALYHRVTYQASPANPVQAFLDAAKATWATLPTEFPGVDWIDVIGLGVQTPVGIPDITKITQSGQMTWDVNGDGVVPSGSAHPVVRRYVSVPCAHDLLPFDGRLYPYMHAGLASGLPADVQLGGSVLALPS